MIPSIVKRFYERGMLVHAWNEDFRIILIEKKSFNSFPLTPGIYKAVALNIDPPEVVAVFRPETFVDYLDMMDQLRLWNYDTSCLCPLVKADIDATS